MKAKKCSKCKKRKLFNKFHKRTCATDGRDSRCKVCKNATKDYEKDKIRLRKAYPKYKDDIRNNFMKRKYGISLSEYNQMLADQNFVCKICHRKCHSGKSLAVDHCHATGKVRGLLCLRCNRGIGHFKDSKELLVAAAAYLG